MTAEAPRFPVTNRGGNKALEDRMKGMGLKYEATHGSYGGPENSYIIHSPTRDQMHHMSQEFGQEAFVYGEGEGGRHELHYSHGPNVGMYHPSFPTVRYSHTQPQDYFTHVPGKGYVSLQFNFDKLHPHGVPSGHPSTLAMKSEPTYPEHHRMNFRRTVGHGVLLTEAEHAKLSAFAKSEQPLLSVEEIRKALLDGLYLTLRKSTKK